MHTTFKLVPYNLQFEANVDFTLGFDCGNICNLLHQIEPIFMNLRSNQLIVTKYSAQN